MAFQRLKMWHWWLIAIVIGVAVALVWTNGSDDAEPTTTYQSKFIRSLNNKTEDGRPVYQSIVIEPVRESTGGELVQRVRFKELRRNANTGQWDPIPGSVVVTVPVMKVAPRPDYRLSDLLDDRAKDMPGLKYSRAWWMVSQLPPDQANNDSHLRPWQRTKGAWVTAIAGSILVIGVLWPLVIRLMVKLGLGYPEEPGGIDLRNVSNNPAAVVGGAGVADSERQRLDDLNAELEANVAGMLMSDSERDEQAEIEAEEAAVRQLQAQRLEESAEVARHEAEKEYGGEFYPVAKTVEKKD